MIALGPMDEGYRRCRILEVDVGDVENRKGKKIMYNLGFRFRVEVDLGLGYWGKFWATLDGFGEGFPPKPFELLTTDAELFLKEGEDGYLLYANGHLVNDAVRAGMLPKEV